MLRDDGPISRAELEILATIGRREGTIDQAEWEVVTNVMNLSERRVSATLARGFYEDLAPPPPREGTPPS